VDRIDRPLAQGRATSRRAVVTGGPARWPRSWSATAPAVAANSDPVLLGQDNSEPADVDPDSEARRHLMRRTQARVVSQSTVCHRDRGARPVDAAAA
jgi:hypothetical protein